MSQNNFRRSTLDLSAAELKVSKEGEEQMVVGHAALFGVPFQPILGFEELQEVFEPGAFSRSLSEGADVRALIDHDVRMLIGRSTAKPKPTLRVKEDKKGLAVEIDLPNTTHANNIRESLRRGDISGMSVGFVPQSETEELIDGVSLRHITDVDLIDVSIVTFPASEDTFAELRSRMHGQNFPFEDLARCFLRGQVGAELRSEDLECVRNSLRLLDEMLETRSQKDAGQSEEAAPSIALLRAQLKNKLQASEISS